MPSVLPMIWNINCRRTRRILALWAGNDLEQCECQVAERHLAVCPSCREVWERLQQSQQLLEKVRPAPFEEHEQPFSAWPPPSVWPKVARQIRSMDDQVELSNWRDWLPTGAVAAACLGIIAVTLAEVPTSESGSPSLIVSSPATYEPAPRPVGRLPLGLVRDGNQQWNNRQAGPRDDDPPRF